jgi:hypothetical protein
MMGLSQGRNLHEAAEIAKAQTHIQALSAIRTHDPSLRKQRMQFLESRGHCDSH